MRTGRRPRGARLQAVCKRAGLIEIPHRFVKAAERRVEVGAGLLKRCMAEHVLDVVHGPAGLDQAGAPFVPEVVEVQVNSSIGRF